MSIEDRKVEKPAQERGTQSDQDATGAVAGRAASISPEAGKDNDASPGAQADKEQAEKR
jgi:hypothetical protein